MDYVKEETVLEIGKISVNATTWKDDCYPREMTFDWTEDSPDPYYPGNDVSVDITKNDALCLVYVLKKHFGI